MIIVRLNTGSLFGPRGQNWQKGGEKSAKELYNRTYQILLQCSKVDEVRNVYILV
jgi:hypothetical protein